MADGSLINGATMNGSFTLQKQVGTLLTLKTAGRYLDKIIELTLNAKSASPAFDGGELTNKGATADFTNMSVSETDTSGVAIQCKGTAGRDAVRYNGAVSGWVDADDADVASSAVDASSWNGTAYYATGVTLGNGKAFDVTVPNGVNGTLTFHFAVDANGNVTIT